MCAAKLSCASDGNDLYLTTETGIALLDPQAKTPTEVLTLGDRVAFGAYPAI